MYAIRWGIGESMAMNATQLEAKERPILFSGPMVRAILEGRKTQTRRVVPVQPQSFGEPKWWEPDFGFAGRPPSEEAYIAEAIKRCRYGQPGDRLWVRETFCAAHDIPGRVITSGVTADNYGLVAFRATTKPDDACYIGEQRFPWRPSIFMPRWASRITLEITEVRVERVQEISEDDIKAEGITLSPSELYPDINTPDKLRQQWEWGWDKLNAKRGYSWESNPWVWAISFKRIK